MNIEKKSEFEPSARSTGLRSTTSSSKKFDMDLDIDSLLRSSICGNVQKEFQYRQSMANQNQENRPYRTTMTTDMNASTKSSFWGRQSGNASKAENFSDESFKPGEEFNALLDKEELEHEQENATIPGYDAEKARKSSMGQSNEPEMSFGAHCNQYQNDNIWQLYSQPSPPKKSRVPLVDVTIDEMSMTNGTMSYLNDTNLRKMISKYRKL